MTTRGQTRAELHNRSGRTLVETLVVVAIIGLLVAILLPAVQSIRESSRGTACQNNLRQSGLALQSHASASGNLPDLYNGSFLPQPRSTLDEFHFHSWRTSILDQIEQANVRQLLDRTLPATDLKNQPAINSRIAVFLCPSTPNGNRNVPDILGFNSAGPPFNPLPWTVPNGGTAARSDYEAVAGVVVEPSFSPDLRVVRVGAWGEPTYKPGTGFSIRYRKARLADITDGLSSTLLVGEKAGRPDLYDRGQVYPYPYRDSHHATDHQQAAWAISTHFYWMLFWHEQAVNQSNSTGIFAFHRGGANVGLADGSVRFLAETTDPTVLTALATRSGSEAVNLE